MFRGRLTKVITLALFAWAWMAFSGGLGAVTQGGLFESRTVAATELLQQTDDRQDNAIVAASGDLAEVDSGGWDANDIAVSVATDVLGPPHGREHPIYVPGYGLAVGPGNVEEEPPESGARSLVGQNLFPPNEQCRSRRSLSSSLTLHELRAQLIFSVSSGDFHSAEQHHFPPRAKRLTPPIGHAFT
jgi:hypothetical protein